VDELIDPGVKSTLSALEKRGRLGDSRGTHDRHQPQSARRGHLFALEPRRHRAALGEHDRAERERTRPQGEGLERQQVEQATRAYTTSALANTPATQAALAGRSGEAQGAQRQEAGKRDEET
jgi:hypothetical protein